MLNACLALLALALPVGAQGKQVALVVANAEYAHTSKLSNPLRDAKLISTALQQAGFETVEIGTDLDRTQFMDRLRTFRSAADGAEAALVYFAGHGIESDGRNWLLPTDTKLDAEKDLPFEAIELQLLLDTLDGARLRIAVLDACRNNPYENRWTSDSRSIARGLAPLEMDDMLVIYAAAPGAVAYDGADGNSPFALALARRLVQPGLPVQMLGGMVRDDVLEATEGEQRPFISASMTGRPLFLVEGPEETTAFWENINSPPPVPSPARVARSPDSDAMKPAASDKIKQRVGGNTKDRVPSQKPATTQNDPVTIERMKALFRKRKTRGLVIADGQFSDEQSWVNALKSDTIPGYRAYLQQFPTGLFASYAKANVDQLLDPTAADGELDSDKPWIISLGAALPNRYAVDLADPLAIDGIWRISTNDKRLRIERGRAFAVDGWNHALLFQVKPEQVTITNLREAGPGQFLGRDILLNGDAELTLREDGNLDVKVSMFPFPAKFVLIREGLDDPDALSSD